MNVWLLVIILSMPWKSEYWPTLMRTPVIWSNTRCHQSRACYYDGTIYLQPKWDYGYFDADLRHALIHEMQHHLQCSGQIWRTDGGWERFEGLLVELLASGELSEEQVDYLTTLLGDTQIHEVHAELPWILDGELPPEFADWYPWFYLEQTSWITAP